MLNRIIFIIFLTVLVMQAICFVVYLRKVVKAKKEIEREEEAARYIEQKFKEARRENGNRNRR